MKTILVPSARLRLVAIPLLLFAVVALITGRASAQLASPPDRMTYQGFLVDGNAQALGSPNPQNYDVIFRIYNHETDGAESHLLWDEQQTVTVDNGYFSVILGEGAVSTAEKHNGLSSLFTREDAADLFVGITVVGIGTGGGDVDILPRLRLLSSPYAFLARYAVEAETAAQTTGNAATATTADKAKLLISPNLANLAVANNGNLAVNGAVTATGNVTANTFVGNGTIPIGGIIMWSGAIVNIPVGWALCAGGTANNGTLIIPDLRNRFIVGAGTGYVVGEVGGQKDVILTTGQTPLRRHTHKFTDFFDADDAFEPAGTTNATHAASGNREDSGDGGPDRKQIAKTTEDYKEPDPVPLIDAHENRPPYFALAFIMRVQ